MISGLRGEGHSLADLLAAAGMARSTYFYLESHPKAPTRPDVREAVAEVWGRTPNGRGHRQVRMALVAEFGFRVSAKTVLKVMREMGLSCRARRPNPWRAYSSFRGGDEGVVPNLIARDFHADGPWEKLGTDVTEFALPGAGAKAYLAAAYDFGSREVVAWSVSRHPDMAQQREMLAMLWEAMPAGASPVMTSDMGWQYQHGWYRGELAAHGVAQSMSRKGNCLDNAPTEGLFGHLKDEFFRGREFGSHEQFAEELGAYIGHWNRRRRQVALGGLTPEEFRNRAA